MYTFVRKIYYVLVLLLKHTAPGPLTLSATPIHLSFITAPGPPQNLTLVNRTCHSIAFQWSPPDDTGRLNVTGYDILHNGAPVATITGTVYTLEGLTPDTVHTINVRTRNIVGPSVLWRTLIAATGERGIRTCTVALIHCRRTLQHVHQSHNSSQLCIVTSTYPFLIASILDNPLMVTAETMSSESIGIGVSPPKPQTGRLHYKCNLTSEDSVQMLSLNDTRSNSPYSVVKDLSPYTNYSATCWVFKDGVDQCYIGSDTTQTYTDSKL